MESYPEQVTFLALIQRLIKYFSKEVVFSVDLHRPGNSTFSENLWHLVGVLKQLVIHFLLCSCPTLFLLLYYVKFFSFVRCLTKKVEYKYSQNHPAGSGQRPGFFPTMSNQMMFTSSIWLAHILSRKLVYLHSSLAPSSIQHRAQQHRSLVVMHDVINKHLEMVL